MKCIRDVHKRMKVYSTMFNPLRQTVSLLRSHGVSMDGCYVKGVPVIEYLEKCQDIWDSTIDKAFKVKEEIQNMQNVESEHLKMELSQFMTEVTRFRDTFCKVAPFNFIGNTPDDAYKLLDQQEVSFFFLVLFNEFLSFFWSLFIIIGLCTILLKLKEKCFFFGGMHVKCLTRF